MPRVQWARCPLSDLAAALVGGTAAGELDSCLRDVISDLHQELTSYCVVLLFAAGQTAAFTVCEFSCSCCKGSITQAADALCTVLTTDCSALQQFWTAANGREALQVSQPGMCLITNSFAFWTEQRTDNADKLSHGHAAKQHPA